MLEALSSICGRLFYGYEWRWLSQGRKRVLRRYGMVLIRSLAEMGMVELSPDQRLPDSAENQYPVDKHDAIIAIRWYHKGIRRMLNANWKKVEK